MPPTASATSCPGPSNRRPQSGDETEGGQHKGDNPGDTENDRSAECGAQGALDTDCFPERCCASDKCRCACRGRSCGRRCSRGSCAVGCGSDRRCDRSRRLDGSNRLRRLDRSCSRYRNCRNCSRYRSYGNYRNYRNCSNRLNWRDRVQWSGGFGRSFWLRRRDGVVSSAGGSSPGVSVRVRIGADRCVVHGPPVFVEAYRSLEAFSALDGRKTRQRFTPVQGYPPRTADQPNTHRRSREPSVVHESIEA